MDGTVQGDVYLPKVAGENGGGKGGWQEVCLVQYCIVECGVV